MANPTHWTSLFLLQRNGELGMVWKVQESFCKLGHNPYWVKLGCANTPLHTYTPPTHGRGAGYVWDRDCTSWHQSTVKNGMHWFYRVQMCVSIYVRKSKKNWKATLWCCSKASDPSKTGQAFQFQNGFNPIWQTLAVLLYWETVYRKVFHREFLRV